MARIIFEDQRGRSRIITEDIIISYLQTADARLLDLPLLNLQKIILAMTADGAQIVEFCIIAIGYHIALVDKLRRIRLNLLTIRSFRVSHTLSCSPTRFRASFLACWQATLMGWMASSAFFNCTTSQAKLCPRLPWR